MPAMDFQGSSSSPFLFGRSILNLRLDQVHSMDSHHQPGSSEKQAAETVQGVVTDLFQDLAGGEELLSLLWVHKLLDVFLLCVEEFRAVLFSNPAIVVEVPLHRIAAEFIERSFNALDVCKAILDGIEQVRQWHKLIEILTLALGPTQETIGEAQLRHASQPIVDLAIAMLNDNDTGSVLANPNHSFSHGRGPNRDHGRAGGHSRSHSGSVSDSLCAARKLQAIRKNLSAPRWRDVLATNGLAVLVFMMSWVLLFVMWALVAAIPCHGRGLETKFSIPKAFRWAAPILSLHKRILEISKKRERRNSCGLLTEIHRMEMFVRRLSELTENIQFPLAEEQKVGIRNAAQWLSHASESMKEGLDSLEIKVKEVFSRIARVQKEGLDYLSHTPV